MFVLLQCLTVLAKTENKKVVNYKTDPTFMTKFTSGIYKNPFGCIGELISNGKDAIVKTDRKGYIDIIVKSNSILVRDNGIGMTRQEGEENISTIGRSSTAEWDDGKDLIGRFGTGLYSLFLLADKATIRSRKENEQGFEVVMHNTNYMEIEDIEIENVGTEVEMFFKEGVTLSVKQVEDFVQQNIMGNDYLYEIRRIKDETEIANEKVALEEAYIANAKKEMIEKRIKEEKDVMKEEEKTEEEKEMTDEEKIEKKKKEKEEEKKQEEEIKKEVEASFQLTEDDRQNIENQKNEVSEYKYLQTAHWTDENDMEVFKTIFKERYGRTDLNLAKKVNFTIRQSNVQNQNFDSRFEAIIFVPTHNEAAMMGNTEMKPGKVEIFVSGSKVPIDLELNDLLKPFYFIIKSNHAEITTTREAFRDSDKTNKAIVNALTRKLVEIFSGQSDKVVHEYSKVIKRGYLDAKKENNDIHEKLVGILTFETKDGIMSLNKFLEHVEKINEAIEAEAKEEKTESEANKELTEGEETEEKKKDEKKTDYKLKVDHLYYTNISKALVNNIENPLFDGILVPYIFLNDIHDEEIMNGLKKHKSLTMKNIISHRFEFREVDAEEHKDTIAFIKDTLKDYVSDVVVSKRLQKYPFSIITNENAMPSAFKAFFGDNKFDDNFMREYFDPKPVLEVNVDSNEYKKIDDTRDANAILTLYLATCVACKVDPYNKVAAFTDLMNAGRAALGIDDKLEPTKKSPQGLEEMIKSMGGDGSMYQDFSDHPDHALDKEYDEDYKKKFNFDEFENLQTEEEDDEKFNDEEMKQELVTEASAEPEVVADSITDEAKDLIEEEKVVEEVTNDDKEMIEEDKENDDVSEMAGEDKDESDEDIEEGFDMDSGDFDFDNFDWSQFEKWSQQQDMSGYDFDFKSEDMKADDNTAGEVREEAIKEEL